MRPTCSAVCSPGAAPAADYVLCRTMSHRPLDVIEEFRRKIRGVGATTMPRDVTVCTEFIFESARAAEQYVLAESTNAKRRSNPRAVAASVLEHGFQPSAAEVAAAGDIRRLEDEKPAYAAELLRTAQHLVTSCVRTHCAPALCGTCTRRFSAYDFLAFAADDARRLCVADVTTGACTLILRRILSRALDGAACAACKGRAVAILDDGMVLVCTRVATYECVKLLGEHAAAIAHAREALSKLCRARRALAAKTLSGFEWSSVLKSKVYWICGSVRLDQAAAASTTPDAIR